MFSTVISIYTFIVKYVSYVTINAFGNTTKNFLQTLAVDVAGLAFFFSHEKHGVNTFGKKKDDLFFIIGYIPIMSKAFYNRKGL